MGLYDHVFCEVDLPDGKSHQGAFQTKDFEDPYLENYTITKDGRLVKDKRDLNFHGFLNFYTYDDKTDEWREFNAKFTDGKLVEIE